MKLKRRALSLNNVVSFAMELREGDELFEVIDDTADSFKRVLLRNGYYTTGPVVFRARPDSREFAIMTTIGNRPNVVGDRDTGFAFESHKQIETDFFHRHFDIEEPVPHADIERAVVEASARAQFHYSESAERFDRFASRITAKGYDANGPFLYSLNNVPLDEMVDIEMFLPIRQSTFAGERDLGCLAVRLCFRGLRRSRRQGMTGHSCKGGDGTYSKVHLPKGWNEYCTPLRKRSF